MNWLLLILSLPTENATARMRAWRALKASGAAVLKDGVYLLPAGAAHHATLAAIAGEVEKAGGTTYLLEATGGDHAGLFDRTAEYERLTSDIAACQADLDRVAARDLARLARKLRKAYDGILATDFFPGAAQARTATLLDALDGGIRARLSPHEPTAAVKTVERRDPAEYQGRLWATRLRPWVDRLASAWLIRRFIDPAARFLWLASPTECPAGAVGFDYDGADFSHVGDGPRERVSFETLMAAFGLEGDPALVRLARVVHYLDVGGPPVAEAPGLEALLGGMREQLVDDDALLAAAAGAFEYLHAHYLSET